MDSYESLLQHIIVMLLITIVVLAVGVISIDSTLNCIKGAMTVGESVSNETLQFCIDNL